jgi:hypothetical protein
VKTKTSFAVDEFNRLLLKDGSGNIPVKGAFSLDEENNLVYTATESASFLKKYKLTRKINFKGNWKLDHNYDFQFKCVQRSADPFDTFVLRGKIISLEAHAVAFELVTADNKGSQHFRVLKFTGDWQVDERARFRFWLKKEYKPDLISFGAAWELNKNQQICYSYQRTNPFNRKKEKHEFSFEGFWEINAANKITYHVSGDAEVFFDFHVRLESPTVYPRDGTIKYRLGAGYSESRRGKVISLLGAWKFSRRAGLNFEMQYAGGHVHSIEFGVDAILDKKDKISVALKDQEGMPLGLSVVFSRKLLAADSEAFVKLQLLEGRTAVFGGVKLPF